MGHRPVQALQGQTSHGQKEPAREAGPAATKVAPVQAVPPTLTGLRLGVQKILVTLRDGNSVTLAEDDALRAAYTERSLVSIEIPLPPLIVKKWHHGGHALELTVASPSNEARQRSTFKNDDYKCQTEENTRLQFAVRFVTILGTIRAVSKDAAMQESQAEEPLKP